MAEFKARYKKGEIQKILLKSGKVINCCCEIELVITYNWSGTGLADLDTSTRATWRTKGSESQGYDCANTNIYMNWIGGDNTDTDGLEIVNVKAVSAKNDNEWSNPSSINIDLYAWWYPVSETAGSGTITITAEYDGQQVSKQVLVTARRTNDDEPPFCAYNYVGTVSFSEEFTLSMS